MQQEDNNRESLKELIKEYSPWIVAVLVLYFALNIHASIKALDPLYEVSRRSASGAHLLVGLLAWFVVSSRLDLGKKYPRVNVAIAVVFIVTLVYTFLVNHEFISPLHIPF